MSSSKLKKTAKIIWVLIKDRNLFRSLTKNIIFFLQIKKYNNVIIISLVEHLGDIVAAEPISRYIKSADAENKIVWITSEPYREIIEINPTIKKVVTVTCLTEWILIKSLFPKLNLYDLHIDGKSCSKHNFKIYNKNKLEINTENYYNVGNLLCCFSQTAGLNLNCKTAPILNLPIKKNTKYEKYILLHTSSNEPERQWNSTGWNQLIDFVSETYPNLMLREIGLTKMIQTKPAQYEDYTGKRSFKEIAYQIQNCSLFIGIDSGFAHIANAYKKNSLILIGEYKTFKKYNPYSGYFQEHRSKLVIYYNGELREMPFTFIQKNLINKINYINK